MKCLIVDIYNKCIYTSTHTSLPTRPHKRQIAGQGETQVHTHFPAYQTAQKADRRSGRNTSTHTLPCLPDRTKGRSPVREKHKYTHTSLPTRPHKRQIAGQGETQVHTHFPAYQTAQKADRRSGRNTSTHTLPCLPDRTKGRSPVREKHKYTHTSLPTRPHKRQIAGQGETQVHTHFLAYQTAQKADRRSGKRTHTCLAVAGMHIHVP